MMAARDVPIAKDPFKRRIIVGVGMLGAVIVLIFYVELFAFSRSRGMDFDILTAAA
jgi:hypothetical protein